MKNVQGRLGVLQNTTLARKETLLLIVDGVDELGEVKKVQLLEGE